MVSAILLNGTMARRGRFDLGDNGSRFGKQRRLIGCRRYSRVRSTSVVHSAKIIVAGRVKVDDTSHNVYFRGCGISRRGGRTRSWPSISVSGFSRLETPGEFAKTAPCLGWKQASLETLTSLACEERNWHTHTQFITPGGDLSNRATIYLCYIQLFGCVYAS
jgi:hypothetical protein